MASPISVVTVFGGVYLLISYAARSFRRRMVQKHTGVADIPFLGITRSKDHKIRGTAVVCGGSIAGLATARICHNHFEKVIIVEPEGWLATEEGWRLEREPKTRSRARVLQYQSIHAVLAFGFMALEKMFPNIREECQKADIGITSSDFKLCVSGRFYHLGDEKEYSALPQALYATRHGLETLLRRLLIGNEQYPNVEQVVGTVTGIITSESDPTTLKGVSVRTDDGEKTIAAALVIDCSGPAEGGLKWLRRAGFGAVNPSADHETVHPLQQLRISYDPRLSYSTFHFTITPSLAERLPVPGGFYSCNAILCLIPDGKQRNAIYMMRFEGDTLQICCNYRGDTERPNNLNEIKAFARNLVLDTPFPKWFFPLLDELHEVEESVTISHIRLPALSYAHYHQASNLPRNWIAIGDSVMRVNPVYAQGCSKALIGAVTLNRILHSKVSTRDLPSNFSELFFEAQAAKIDPIWDGTKALDYAHDSTVPMSGESRSVGQVLRWYSGRINFIGSYDGKVGTALHYGINLISPTTDYFQPSIVLKVLWDAFRRPFA